MSEITREALADAIAKDSKAAPAFASLPTAHRQIVTGACATIERANGDADAIAKAKTSICGDDTPLTQEWTDDTGAKRSSTGPTTPALAGGADIWAAIAAAAGL